MSGATRCSYATDRPGVNARPACCVYPDQMSGNPQNERDRDRPAFAQRAMNARNTVWSWLTDPAVLVYRRAAHGQAKARVLIVEFFLFVREVTREFWAIEGTS